MSSRASHAIKVLGKDVVVTAREGIDIATALASSQLQDWARSVQEGLDVRRVHIQDVDMFGPRVGFVKFKADVFVDDTQIPGIVFARGGSVAILVVLQCDGELYTVLTSQPRVPGGKASFREVPAGMLDGEGHFKGVAAKELEEEVGLTIDSSALRDLTAEAYGDGVAGVYPSIGGCDEFLRLYSYEASVTREELEGMQGKATGCREEGEVISLHIVPLADVWKLAPDAKTLSILHLYDKLVLQAGKQ
jgi:ADP-sugar diphosphatase